MGVILDFERYIVIVIDAISLSVPAAVVMSLRYCYDAGSLWCTKTEALTASDMHFLRAIPHKQKPPTYDY